MAKKSNAVKEEILIESFEILKDNIEKNISKLKEIIGKVSDLNLDLSIEMWKYILNNSKSLIKEDGYSYTSGIIYNIEKKIGVEKTIQILKNNMDILEVCFNISSDIYISIVDDMFKYDEAELADITLEMINSNKNKERVFASYLEELCEYFVDNFEDVQEFDEDWDNQEEHDQKVALASKGSTVLIKWVKTIKDKEQKARLNVTLIDYV